MEWTPCDQIIKLFLSIFPFKIVKIYPLSIKNRQVIYQLCQILTKPSNMAKCFLNVAKLAKFRQIWSHWSHRCAPITTYYALQPTSTYQIAPPLTSFQNVLQRRKQKRSRRRRRRRQSKLKCEASVVSQL